MDSNAAWSVVDERLSRSPARQPVSQASQDYEEAYQAAIQGYSAPASQGVANTRTPAEGVTAQSVTRDSRTPATGSIAAPVATLAARSASPGSPVAGASVNEVPQSGRGLPVASTSSAPGPAIPAPPPPQNRGPIPTQTTLARGSASQAPLTQPEAQPGNQVALDYERAYKEAIQSYAAAVSRGPANADGSRAVNVATNAGGVSSAPAAESAAASSPAATATGSAGGGAAPAGGVAGANVNEFQKAYDDLLKRTTEDFDQEVSRYQKDLGDSQTELSKARSERDEALERAKQWEARANDDASYAANEQLRGIRSGGYSSGGGNSGGGGNLASGQSAYSAGGVRSGSLTSGPRGRPGASIGVSRSAREDERQFGGRA
jgi:uncharacterized membrane protein YgcG